MATRKNDDLVKLTRVMDDELTRERRRARVFVLSLIGLLIGLFVLAFTAAFIEDK